MRICTLHLRRRRNGRFSRRSLLPDSACFPKRAIIWAVLIGGDLAPVPLQIFTDAFAMLDCPSHRVVLGPSRDGGYYLVGCNRPTPEIFMGMTWSHDQVLAQTVARLTALQMDVQLLPCWFDIDTLDDLRYLQTLSDPVLRKALATTLPLLRRFRFA
jgi:uncharacterized protein